VPFSGRSRTTSARIEFDGRPRVDQVGPIKSSGAVQPTGVGYIPFALPGLRLVDLGAPAVAHEGVEVLTPAEGIKDLFPTILA